MKKAFVLFLFVVNACGVHAGDLEDTLHQDLYSQRPDLFLRKKFFNDVEKRSSVNDIKRVVLKGINTGGSFLIYLSVSFLGNGLLSGNLGLNDNWSERFFELVDPGAQGGNLRRRPINVNQWTVLKIFSAVASFGCGLISATLFYKFLDKLIDLSAPEKDYEYGSYEVLKEFLVNWEKYKVCTPEKFHVFFDKLHDYYEENCLLEETSPYAAEIDEYWGDIGGDMGVEPGVEADSDCEFKAKAYEIVQYVRAALDGEQQESPQSPEGFCYEGLPTDELRGDI